MNIRDALMLISADKIMKRTCWASSWIFYDHGTLVFQTAGKAPEKWSPAVSDICAEDWITYYREDAAKVRMAGDPPAKPVEAILDRLEAKGEPLVLTDNMRRPPTTVRVKPKNEHPVVSQEPSPSVQQAVQHWQSQIMRARVIEFVLPYIQPQDVGIAMSGIDQLVKLMVYGKQYDNV